MTNDPFIEAVAHHHESNRAYAASLVADLSEADMTSQPVPGRVMNHAAWVLAHLGVYGPILGAMLRSRPFADPMNHVYGRASKPLGDPSAYPPKAELLRVFTEGYDDAVAAMRAAPASVLAAPTPLERWREKRPRLADLCAHILLVHPATHLGQLSAWRRAGGRPPV